jgi:hypothetical protein
MADAAEDPAAAPAGLVLDFGEHIDEDLALFQQDPTISDALSAGKDLRQYAREIQEELHTVEEESVVQYVQEAETAASLFKQTQDCDTVLALMQEVLRGFQEDLCGISDEIRHLQDQSTAMNLELTNRRDVQGKLQAFLDNVALPENMIKTICDGDINEAFAECLPALSQKLRYCLLQAGANDGSSLGVAPSTTQSVRDVRPFLTKLKIKAVYKTRKFLFENVLELSKPKMNVQMFQTNRLLKYRYLMQFLVENDAAAAADIRTAYAETMARTLFTVFRSYHSSLLKLHDESANKGDLIVAEDSPLSSGSAGAGAGAGGAGVDGAPVPPPPAAAGMGFGRSLTGSLGSSLVSMASGMFSPAKSVSPDDHSALIVGKRIQVLVDAEEDALPITVHVAVATKAKYPYEQLFYSIHRHLMDAAVSEYLFLRDFFRLHYRELFNRIFAK